MLTSSQQEVKHISDVLKSGAHGEGAFHFFYFVKYFETEI
jgi:hypothetical protein